MSQATRKWGQLDTGSGTSRVVGNPIPINPRRRAMTASEQVRKTVEGDLEWRNIGPNPNAVKNYGENPSPQARFAQGLDELTSLASKKDIDKPGAERAEALAAELVRLGSAGVEANKKIVADRKEQDRKDEVTKNQKAITRLAAEVEHRLEHDPVLNGISNKFYAVGQNSTTVLNIQTRLRGLRELTQIKEPNVVNLRRAQEYNTQLIGMWFPQYKSEEAKAVIAARQIPVKDALGTITGFETEIADRLQQINWSASPVVNKQARTPTGRVGHLRAQLDKTAESIKAAGDKADSKLLKLAQRQRDAIIQILDARDANSVEQDKVDAIANEAQAIADEAAKQQGWGSIAPSSIDSDDNSEKGEMAKLLAGIRFHFNVVSKATARGESLRSDTEYVPSVVAQGILDGIKSKTGITEAPASPKAVTEASADKPISQQIDELYESVRAEVHKGESPWPNLRSEAYLSPADQGTTLGTVGKLMGNLLERETKAKSIEAKIKAGTAEADAGTRLEALIRDAKQDAEDAIGFIKSYAVDELKKINGQALSAAKARWQDISLEEVSSNDQERENVVSELTVLDLLSQTTETEVSLADIPSARRKADRVQQAIALSTRKEADRTKAGAIARVNQDALSLAQGKWSDIQPDSDQIHNRNAKTLVTSRLARLGLNDTFANQFRVGQGMDVTDSCLTESQELGSLVNNLVSHGDANMSIDAALTAATQVATEVWNDIKVPNDKAMRTSIKGMVEHDLRRLDSLRQISLARAKDAVATNSDLVKEAEQLQAQVLASTAVYRDVVLPLEQARDLAYARAESIWPKLQENAANLPMDAGRTKSLLQGVDEQIVRAHNEVIEGKSDDQQKRPSEVVPELIKLTEEFTDKEGIDKEFKRLKEEALELARSRYPHVSPQLWKTGGNTPTVQVSKLIAKIDAIQSRYDRADRSEQSRLKLLSAMREAGDKIREIFAEHPEVQSQPSPYFRKLYGKDIGLAPINEARTKQANETAVAIQDIYTAVEAEAREVFPDIQHMGVIPADVKEGSPEAIVGTNLLKIHNRISFAEVAARNSAPSPVNEWTDEAKKFAQVIRDALVVEKQAREQTTAVSTPAAAESTVEGNS